MHIHYNSTAKLWEYLVSTGPDVWATLPIDAAQFTAGKLALARGGTNADLSASGAATHVLAQDAAHVITARALIAADIPNLDVSKITTGLLALARGGTHTDLSATGGTSKFLKQASAGSDITVVQPAGADLSDYAVGTWTPVIGGDGGQSGQAYSNQNGYYIKIGRLVFISYYVTLSTKGTITGTPWISGFPFANNSAGGAYSSGDICQWGPLNTTWVKIGLRIDPGNSAGYLFAAAAATTTLNTTLVVSDILNTTLFIGHAMYMTA